MAFLVGKSIRKISTVPDDTSAGRVTMEDIRLLENADEWNYNFRKRLDKQCNGPQKLDT